MTEMKNHVEEEAATNVRVGGPLAMPSAGRFGVMTTVERSLRAPLAPPSRFTSSRVYMTAQSTSPNEQRNTT